ncbi:hypothetical protein A4X06_0g9208, partial [Tilletia controversa]
MKETEGDSPRNGKVIQTYQSGVVFLFSRDISENNGVWYASPSRLTPLTPRHMGTSVKDSLDKMNPAMNMQLMASRGIDPTAMAHVALGGRTKDYFKGRHVVVVKGPFKGCRGIIKETLPDGMARVELHTTNRNETFPLAILKEKDPHTGQSKPLAIGGGPGSNFGPAQGRSNMSTPYSSGPNGIMGPPVMPMGGRTPYGGMAPGMGGGGATTYGAAMSGSATAYGGGTGYGGQTAYGNMANGGKTPAYYTSTGGDQVPAYGVNNHGRTPAVGFGGARTPFGAGMGNDGGRTPFQAPGGVTSFAGPGRGLGGATPRAAAAAYGGGTPNWSAGNKTPAHLLAGYGQGASGAATPYHPGGGGDGPSGYQAVADPRRRVQLGGATPMPYYAAPTPAAAAATPGAFAAPTPGDLGAAPTPAAAPTPGAPTPAGYNAPTPGGDGAPTPGYSAPTPAVQSYHDGGSTSSNANQRVYPVRDAAVRILRYEDASLVGKIVLVVSPSKAEPVEATCIVRDAGTPGDIEIAVTDVEIVHPTRMKELCVVLHGEWRGSRGTVTETTDSRIVLRMTDQQMLEFPRAHVATVLS